MKKIGILTQPLHNNYGGILQAYSLQHILHKEGYDVWIIDRDYKKVPFWTRITSPIKIFFSNLIRLLRGKVLKQPSWIIDKQLAEISKETSRFVSQYIKRTEKVTTTNGLSKICKKYNFDGYVVGSDQVWRPVYSPEIGNYYLDFLQDVKNVKKIVYAASFGVDEWEYTDEETARFARYVSLFDAISVREDSAVALCKKYFNIEAQHVLDPTMLLNKSDFIQLALESKEEKISERLFYYILDPTPEKQLITDTVADILKLPSFTVMPAKRFSSEMGKDINECVFPAVTKWIRAFMDAEYIITDSFHGGVFSIIFNKPFIVIGNDERGLSRINSLLGMFDIKERLIMKSGELNEELVSGKFDWEKINQKRNELAIESLSFLRNNLESGSFY